MPSYASVVKDLTPAVTSLTVTAKGDFACHKCGKSFKSAPALGQHDKAGHVQTMVLSSGQNQSRSPSPSPVSTPASSVTQSKFRCDLCSRGFSSQKGLQNHSATSSAHKKQLVGLLSEKKPQVNDEKPKAGLSTNDPRWSEMLPREHQQILKALSGMCHSLEDLASKKFLLNGEYSTDSSLFAESKDTPAPVESRPKRAAVALDCEMVEVGRTSECISLSAVDFMTGIVLIHSLVDPLFPVTSWRTKHSGVRPSDLKKAKREGRALQGFVGARVELYKYIDSSTILVGHALDNDLRVLRMAHYSIVDSQIVARNAIAVKADQWSLKRLCEAFPDIEIQRDGEAHDSREDALATREVILCFARNPENLESWAAKQRQAAVIKQKEAASKKFRLRYAAENFDEHGW